MDKKFGENKARPDNGLNRKFCGLNCGLNEIAVYDYLKSNPEALQKEIAEAIGKSIRTVESTLKTKGLF